MPVSQMRMPQMSAASQPGTMGRAIVPGRTPGYGSSISTPGTPQVPLGVLGPQQAFGGAQQLSAVPPQLSAVPQPIARAPPSSAAPLWSQGQEDLQANGVLHKDVWSGDLQAEIARRQAAEARVRELEALVSRLRQRCAALEGKRVAASEPQQQGLESEEDGMLTDPIDRTICEYLERNPDFPVSVQKVAPNYYVFGDRGTVYVTQRGEHIVVRVGGGFKSLQVFMDERALMVTREAAAALSEKTQMILP